MSSPNGVDPEIGRLIGLAQAGSAESRADLFLSIAELMRATDRKFTPNESELLLSILRQLARQVEMSVRQALAERLTERDEAPTDLILLLANDRIEVARPLLQRSKLLSEDDLIAIVRDATQLHQLEIASRDDVKPRLAQALSESSSVDVLLALLANRRAELGEAALRRMAERSQTWPELQRPVLARPEMTEDLAKRMCAYVSEALSGFIVDRFGIDPAVIKSELAAAAVEAHARLTKSSGPQRLVEKLAAAGQLKPAFAVKALAQGQIDVFEHAVAKLLDAPAESLRKSLKSADAKVLALVCHAVGIDRSVFATLYQQSEALRGRAGILSQADRSAADEIFQSVSRDAAREALLKRLH